MGSEIEQASTFPAIARLAEWLNILDHIQTAFRDRLDMVWHQRPVRTWVQAPKTLRAKLDDEQLPVPSTFVEFPSSSNDPLSCSCIFANASAIGDIPPTLIALYTNLVSKCPLAFIGRDGILMFQVIPTMGCTILQTIFRAPLSSVLTDMHAMFSRPKLFIRFSLLVNTLRIQAGLFSQCFQMGYAI